MSALTEPARTLLSFCDKYLFLSPDAMDDAMALSIRAIFNLHKMQGNDTVFHEKNNSLQKPWSEADKVIRKVEEKLLPTTLKFIYWQSCLCVSLCSYLFMLTSLSQAGLRFKLPNTRFKVIETVFYIKTKTKQHIKSICSL